MSRYFIAYAGVIVVMAALDALWLAVIARDFYRSQIGPLLLEQPRMATAAAFYLAYSVGVVVFAVMPAANDASLARALGLGALLGLVAYMTYDLTNYATLKGWTLRLVVVDIAWGAFISAMGAAGGWLALAWQRH